MKRQMHATRIPTVFVEARRQAPTADVTPRHQRVREDHRRGGPAVVARKEIDPDAIVGTETGRDRTLPFEKRRGLAVRGKFEARRDEVGVATQTFVRGNVSLELLPA